MDAIYLDYMATTPVDERVVEAMMACLGVTDTFGNPASSTHRYGFAARRLVDTARQQVAQLISAEPREIVWTSGATESDNLAIKGAADFYARRGKHIITMATEHKAVLDTCKYLEGCGYEVTYLKPEKNGLLSLEALEAAFRNDTILVSVMYVNNETGVIQDMQSIAALVKSRGALLHIDAAQANGKVKIDVQKLPVDLLSMSGHKAYGPKGIGALYVRSKPKVNLTPMIHGGQHECGMRSGTLATHQIVGMGLAYEIAAEQMQADWTHAYALKQAFKDGLHNTGIVYTVDEENCVPYCLSMAFPNIRSEALMLATPQLSYSSGSACNSATPLPSHVLTAMGAPIELADCTVRLSTGRYTTLSDIESAVKILADAGARLNHVVSGS
jgi:cysteine desulfurase